MAEFKISRNASGYYDETAYKGIMQSAHPGEIWKQRNLSGGSKDFLIICNHGYFSSALQLLEQPVEDGVEITSTAGFTMYTDPRMVCYIYNDKMTKYIARTTDACFEDIIQEIAVCLGIKENRKAETFEMHKTIVPYVEPSIEVHDDTISHKEIKEMVALFGIDAVKDFLKISIYKSRCRQDFEKADLYLNQLMELAGE